MSMAQTTYEGRFGRLCQTIPLFDASAPAGWGLTYRSWTRTDWAHRETGLRLTCINTSQGWDLLVETPGGDVLRCLPTAARRWDAFDAAGDFLEGEPLLVAESDGGGLVSIGDFRDE